MSELLEHQAELDHRISSIVDNLKKKGRANITQGVIRARLENLESLWKQFENTHRILLTRKRTEPALEKDEYFQKGLFSETSETYLDQKAALLDMSPTPGSGTTQSSVSQTNTTTQGNETRPRDSLPKIPIPKFDGQFAEWPKFANLFESRVLKDSALTNVEKLYYLQNSLTGDAELLIKNLPATDGAFERAWAALKERFDNKRQLVDAQFKILTSITAVTKESAAELKKLLYTTCSVSEALVAISRPIWGTTDLLVYITSAKMDRESRKEWSALMAKSREPPTFSELKNFLEARIDTLNSLEGQLPAGKKEKENSSKAEAKGARILQTSTAVLPPKSQECPLCQESHPLFLCEKYTSKTPADRKTYVKEKRLCFNCLGRHSAEQCRSVKTCLSCRRKHHTSLHEVAGKGADSPTSMTASTELPRGNVVLATAIVRSTSTIGTSCLTRALLDNGSQVSLISEALVQTLNLRRRRATLPLFGISGALSATSRGVVEVNLAPYFNSTDTVHCLAYVLPTLTSYTTTSFGVTPAPKEFGQIQLADPDLSRKISIDLVLGADIYPHILRHGLKCDSTKSLVAQKTIFGWILLGNSSGSTLPSSRLTSLQVSVDESLMKAVARFWELEKVEVTTVESPEDRQCEEHYRSTYTRDREGRYSVRLPFRSDEALGNSKEIALRRFAALERRLAANPALKGAYTDFMAEYHQLGHMVISAEPENGYFLPHHEVYRKNSTTTKLRVVFNASQRTATGKSLNELLLCGPNLLPDLADVLLRWRRHRVALVADVSKMYRQIRIHPDDQRFQKIVWRATPATPVRTHQLTTVTYGTACAPFLAIRTLQQLATDERTSFPRASTALMTNVYMDDILTGADSIDEARELKQQLQQLCMAGGFPLHKWQSNCEVFQEDRNHSLDRAFGNSEEQKVTNILGVQWNSTHDQFLTSVSEVAPACPSSKRQILSEIARLFDPLGWLSPVVSWAKCFMQDLWLLKVSWDSELPAPIVSKWEDFRSELPQLNSIRIARHLGNAQHYKELQLHGFSDASERAIAAVLYTRVEHSDGTITVHLVGARTKVAPLKTVSLPRLELCAATLLAQFADRVVRVLQLSGIEIHCWTDSTVTLAWLQGRPTKWKTFVANRVSEVQTRLPQAQWHHVEGKQNPADCASRGLMPSSLPGHKLWWTGPELLYKNTIEFPVPIDVRVEEEIRPPPTQTHTLTAPDNFELLHRYSDIRRLDRIIAWCCRWLPDARRSRGSPQLLGPEIQQARLRCIKIVQQQHFQPEIKLLRHDKELPKSSPLSRLTPFLDGGGLLRVRGRLQHSRWTDQQKHPLILPSQSVLAALIIAEAHLRCLHGGTQATLATLRQDYWINRGRQVVKTHIHRCRPCIRWKGRPIPQRMGDLPGCRVTPGRPFLNTGVDYAGPFQLKTMRGRGSRVFKGYVALFICMTTRALHLEAVMGADAQSFLAALKRFMSRRGLCRTIYSDCGTNFIGANRELREFVRLTNQVDSATVRFCASERIEWKFNPPSAANFGGLWEAGVKSVKYHLRRVVGAQTLTFEEFATFLASIEACLNSRPLQALSDDPDELTFLTPGHFLIGAPLTAYPEPNVEGNSLSRLSRWQLLSRLQQDFWRTWSREYLQTLQPRPKWRHQQPEVKKGDLCFVLNETLHPTRWPLGQIEELHPGPDGLTRVVTLRTATATLKRPVSKLILFPSASRDAGSNPRKDAE